MNDEKMIIAIDYDDSFTTNKTLFSNFIEMIKLSNTHIPVFCTAREGKSFDPSKDRNFEELYDKDYYFKNKDIYNDSLNLNIPVVFSYGYKSKRDALIKHGYKIYKDQSFYCTDKKLSNVIYFDDYPENIISMYKKESSIEYKIVDEIIFYDYLHVFKTIHFDENNDEKYYLWIYDEPSEDIDFLCVYKIFDITNNKKLFDSIDNFKNLERFCEKRQHDYRVKVKVFLDMYSEILRSEHVKFI